MGQGFISSVLHPILLFAFFFSLYLNNLVPLKFRDDILVPYLKLIEPTLGKREELEYEEYR